MVQGIGFISLLAAVIVYGLAAGGIKNGSVDISSIGDLLFALGVLCHFSGK